MTPEQTDAIKTIVDFAERSRDTYDDTREWTSRDNGSCMTIRVPVALLNRIRELGDELATLE